MGMVDRTRRGARAGGTLVILLFAAALSTAAPAAVRYAYDVVAGAEAHELQIDARFTPGTGGCYAVDEGSNGFVAAAEIETKGKWRALVPRSGCVDVPAAPLVHVRYVFHLAEATAGRRRGDAWQRSGALFARPSVWLLRPEGEVQGAFTLHVHTPAGIRFATGLLQTAEDTYEGRADFIDRTPYALFGNLQTSSLDVGGGRIDVALVAGDLTVGHDDIEEWVRRAAQAVTAYMGVFPLPRVLVAVVPSERGRVGYGTTWGYGGASIVISVGHGASRADLMSDWELTHEMTHLTLPNMPRGQRWMEEGLATYVEPFARVRAGQLDEHEMWRDLVRQIPTGLPLSGDQGLDQTHTWARTYWGGALFWFVVDVRLREHTEGRIGVPELLRGLHEEKSDIRIEWSVSDLLQAADRITKTTVVRDTYAELAEKPGKPDLESFWTRLGIRAHDGDVSFDDAAPLATIRRAMTAAVRPSS
jgi:hypothetical protein